MTMNEVLVLLDGDEVRQCPQCCAPAFAMRTEFRSDGANYHTRTTIWCQHGHERVVVTKPEPLDDEMRELLA